ncbi:MAG: sigma-54-dependent Fis family transcriptional regulator [Bacteroidota bacterium]|nr:sigma-54-dependent Fis family transcriptional regulator [Bacteroidota bacterium]
MSERILIVDDEELIRESLSYVLQKEGYEIDEAENGKQAFDKVTRAPYDIVITDIEMPEMRGTELLEKIAQRSPQTFVIIITAYASIETAVDALRKGAYDYILKPIEFDDLIFRIKKLLVHRDLALENTLLRQELNRHYDFGNIIGQSAAMQKVFQTIKKVATSDGTVLITGKSGTGKELVARAIHYNSKRQHKRFAAINCGAIVETLFESELFGHKKGSFTGAVADKEGIFKVAEGGTLLLDEVSEIPYHLQVKLLRALEQREIFPVGSNDPINIDVRIIAATNRNLREEVAGNKFREDLFYRLDVVEIHLPSLVERVDDIPLLVNHFLEDYRKEMGRNVKGITNQAMNLLMRYHWKGEVRELQNVIERAMIFCEGEYIDTTHLPEYMQKLGTPNAFGGESTSGSVSLKDATKNFERHYIEQTLQRHNSNKETAAHELGISLSSLYRKMEELNIPVKQSSVPQSVGE